MYQWVFEGVLRISPTYEILASKHLGVVGNLPGYLTDLEGRTIFLPSESAYWPDAESLKWHGEHVFPVMSDTGLDHLLTNSEIYCPLSPIPRLPGRRPGLRRDR